MAAEQFFILLAAVYIAPHVSPAAARSFCIFALVLAALIVVIKVGAALALYLLS